MRRPAEPDVVDRSRDGFLVHDAQSEGRGLRVTTYIEGLQGDSGRLCTDERLICRTSEQSRAIAQLLRQARHAPDCSVDNRIEDRCSRGTRGCTILHERFALLEEPAATSEASAKRAFQAYDHFLVFSCTGPDKEDDVHHSLHTPHEWEHVRAEVRSAWMAAMATRGDLADEARVREVLDRAGLAWHHAVVPLLVELLAQVRLEERNGKP